MICYDVINPSDACTFLAPDRTVALVALIFMGEGMYAGRAIARDLEPISRADAEPLDVPLFISNITPSYDDWWKDAGYTEEPVGLVLRTRKADLVAALRSAAYGDLEDRRTYTSALDAITDDEKRAEFVRAWEDRRRSSLNRIVQRAWAWADRIEKGEVAA